MRIPGELKDVCLKRRNSNESIMAKTLGSLIIWPTLIERATE